MFDLLGADTFLAAMIFGIVVLSVLFWHAAMGRTWFVSALVWFMAQGIMFLIGTMLYADLHSTMDRDWLVLNLAALFAVLVGAMITNASTKFWAGDEIRRFCDAPVTFDIEGAFLKPIYGIAFIAVIVGAVFASAVGYNVFTSALSDYVNSGDYDPIAYRTMRVSISTDRYVAVGYTIQFTAHLLPLIVLLLYLRALHTRKTIDAVAVAALFAADVYFLTITGGRGWLLHVGVLFMLLFSRVGPFPRTKQAPAHRIVTALVLLGAGVFYATASKLMGRVEGSGSALASNAIGDFIDRNMGRQAEAELFLMRHFMVREPVWGSEWLEGLSTLIPINRNPHGFGSDLHAMVNNGDTSGSMGLSIWGSYWYNWGTVGMLLFAMLTGGLMQLLTVKYVRGPRTLLRVVVFFVAGYRLTSFHDPYTLLLEGFPTVMLFYALTLFVARLEKPMSLATATASPGAAPAAARRTFRGSRVS